MQDEQRLLRALSSYIKGNIDLSLFLSMKEIYIAEMRVKNAWCYYRPGNKKIDKLIGLCEDEKYEDELAL